MKMRSYLTQVAFVLAIASSIFASTAKSEKSVCIPRNVDDDPTKMVCACSQGSCPDIELSWPEQKGSVFIYESSISGKRLSFSDLNERELKPKRKRIFRRHASAVKVDVHLNKEHQPILGWGGAFTDSFGINVASLSKDLQDKLIESYYGANGLQYNFGRVPISGTDFSTRPYSYDDSSEPDFELKKWALAEEDFKFKLPYIKQALDLAKREQNVDVKLFASTWSAPAWMKTKNSLVRGHLIDDDKVYQTYAKYLMKFFDAYKQEGINFWGATVQNEPVASYLPIYFFNSMQFSNSEMIKFIGNYLGPALEARGYNKQNFKLIIGDDSLGFLNHQVPEVMADPKVQKYISGLAFHWYTSGSIISYDKLTKLYETLKDKIEFMMMSEACEGSMPNQKKVVPGSWDRAESYASDIIEDLNRETGAWIDWNMALDLQGGPNWSKNFVDSPILVDAKRNEFYKQPMYYSLAHFSRFFKPGSIRVETTQDKSGLLTVAVHNKETNHVVVNILNKSNSEKTIKLSIDSQNGDLKDFVVDKRSITTVIVKV